MAHGKDIVCLLCLMIIYMSTLMSQHNRMDSIKINPRKHIATSALHSVVSKQHA